MKMVRHLHRYLGLGMLFTLSGCHYAPESTAKLASSSRLPKWVALPQGLSRADLSVTMDYYVKPWGSGAKFIVEDTKNQILQTIDGGSKCKETFHMEDPGHDSPSGYPAYQAITVNGVTEIFEHRTTEPIVSVTDDTAVWKHYLGIGCD